MNKNLKNFSARQSLIVAILSFVILFAEGCGSGKPAPIFGADGVYDAAMKAFKDNDFYESGLLFDRLKTQYPTSKYADAAQYYIAEMHFKKGEYIMAVFNYNQLVRSYPSSEFAKIALYKAGLSYIELSPSFDRYQEYTKNAIQVFNEFKSLYAKDSLAVESGKRIVELRNKLAEHDFSTAELYLKLAAPRSSLIYYDAVIADYQDTKFFEPAFVGKIKILARLKRDSEAKEAIRLYRQQFPKGILTEEVDSVAKSIQ